MLEQWLGVDFRPKWEGLTSEEQRRQLYSAASAEQSAVQWSRSCGVLQRNGEVVSRASRGPMYAHQSLSCLWVLSYMSYLPTYLLSYMSYPTILTTFLPITSLVLLVLGSLNLNLSSDLPFFIILYIYLFGLQLGCISSHVLT